MGGSALTDQVSIRNAEERDLEQVEALEIANFSRPWPIDMLRRQLPSDRHEFLVAAQGEKVLGYIGMLHVMDEGYISNVAVDETARRAGIGSMLVEGMLRRCEALSLLFVTLEVRASNEPAIRLYDQHTAFQISIIPVFTCAQIISQITEQMRHMAKSDGREVLTDQIFSQAALHAVYGGVVPEIASRSHVEVISQLADRALAEAGVTRKDIDAVAVTCAPGLIGALLVGVNFAKSTALALGVPLIPVHHIRGHIAANYIAYPELEPPFVCLAISGGNTLICDVRDYTDMRILGATRDDAAGECFDKTARVLGLP